MCFGTLERIVLAERHSPGKMLRNVGVKNLTVPVFRSFPTGAAGTVASAGDERTASAADENIEKLFRKLLYIR